METNADVKIANEGFSEEISVVWYGLLFSALSSKRTYTICSKQETRDTVKLCNPVGGI